jgi:hypothetical protein
MWLLKLSLDQNPVVICYESRILQRLDDVGITHKHVSNETLEIIFAVVYLRIIVV